MLEIKKDDKEKSRPVRVTVLARRYSGEGQETE